MKNFFREAVEFFTVGVIVITLIAGFAYALYYIANN